MPKEEYPCGQCGKPILGRWKPVSKWVSMQWSDTAPVQMRTKRETCPHCHIENDIIEIRPKDTSKLIKITKKNVKQKD